MFATAMRGFFGYGFVAALFYLAGWSLQAAVPAGALRAAPPAAQAGFVLLALGLALGWAVFFAAAVLCAVYPLLPEGRAERRIEATEAARRAAR